MSKNPDQKKKMITLKFFYNGATRYRFILTPILVRKLFPDTSLYAGQGARRVRRGRRDLLISRK